MVEIDDDQDSVVTDDTELLLKIKRLKFNFLNYIIETESGGVSVDTKNRFQACINGLQGVEDPRVDNLIDSITIHFEQLYPASAEKVKRIFG